MKIKPANPSNFVTIDCAPCGDYGGTPKVPIGELSEQEFEQFSQDTLAALRVRWERGRSALQQRP